MQKLLAALLTLLVSAFCLAADPQIGRDYVNVDPPLAATKGKIEVLEFFSYGCPHCNDFHPHIAKWAAKLPKDVSFRRAPVSFNRDAWVRLARIFYALDSIGGLASHDADVFAAIHQQRVNFNSDDAVFAWAAKKGIDSKKFADAFNSFSMQSQVQRGDQESVAARIQGVPALVIDGRFLIVNEAAGHSGLIDGKLLDVADRLIAKARRERKSK